jgi:5,5'-dehydrodivanillate O-demethylase
MCPELAGTAREILMADGSIAGNRYQDYAHIGPDTLGGKLLRRSWQPVIVGDDLEAGNPRRVKLLGEYFTAYRGEDGTANIVADECPHRLTKLSLGWVEGNCIRCFYHGWMFDGEGHCVEQPAEKESFKDKVCIKGYPVREYLGLIFAYFGEGEAPPFPLFPEIDVEKDTVLYNSHPVPCNFFQRIENDLDEVHLHFVHRVGTSEIGLNELPEIEVSETEYGIHRRGRRSNDGTNVDRTGRIFMPNSMMVITPGRAARPEWILHLAWRVPVDDEEMLSFIVTTKKGGGGGLARRPHADPDPMYYTQEILAGRMRVQDIDPDYSGLFNVQDNIALSGQGRIVDRSRERLGQSDKGIILMRKLWEREMRAISEGGEVKDWRRPPENLLEESDKEVQFAYS